MFLKLPAKSSRVLDYFQCEHATSSKLWFQSLKSAFSWSRSFIRLKSWLRAGDLKLITMITAR